MSRIEPARPNLTKAEVNSSPYPQNFVWALDHLDGALDPAWIPLYNVLPGFPLMVRALLYIPHDGSGPGFLLTMRTPYHVVNKHADACPCVRV